MNQFHYRPEDRFKETSNAMKLKELHEKRDYNALLELALLLNYQAAFNYSRMIYFCQEALEASRPVADSHEKMATEMQNYFDSQKAA